MSNNKWQGLACILVVVNIWGSSFAITRVAVQEMPALTFALLRFFTGCLILLPILLLKTRTMPAGTFKSLPWGTLTGMALTGIAIYFFCFNLSLQSISASTGALIQGFIPGCIALFAAIFLKEKLSLRQLIGITLSIAGVIAIGFLGDKSTRALSQARGSVYMILAVLSWAFYTILSKKLARLDPLVVISLTTLIGTVLLLPMAVYENRLTGFPAIATGGWVAIIYLGVFGSALGYFLYSKALETLPAAMVGNFINLDPVIGLIIAIIFLHESINMAQAGGGVLVLTGVLLSTTGMSAPAVSQEK